MERLTFQNHAAYFVRKQGRKVLSQHRSPANAPVIELSLTEGFHDTKHVMSIVVSGHVALDIAGMGAHKAFAGSRLG